MKKPLFLEPDTKGYRPDMTLVNTQWVHTNGTVYTIERFLYDAERDVWTVAYREPTQVTHFTRTPDNFFGKNAEGQDRFRRIFSEKPQVVYRNRAGELR